ncbi:MAG: hypothetical protein WBV82_33205 [Myxococcaceae bacterium]
MAAFAAQGLAACGLLPKDGAVHNPGTTTVRRLALLTMALLVLSLLFGWEAP